MAQEPADRRRRPSTHMVTPNTLSGGLRLVGTIAGPGLGVTVNDFVNDRVAAWSQVRAKERARSPAS